MYKSTTRASRPKPHPDFPPFHHKSGRWAKEIRGSFKYFGKVSDDPEGKAALELWLDQKDDLLAGRTPRTTSDGMTVAELLNRFMESRQEKMQSGEMVASSFGDYFATCERLINAFGRRRAAANLQDRDFQKLRAEMAAGWSKVTLANEINRERAIFNWARDNKDLRIPIPYGPDFRRPAKKALKEERHKKRKQNGKRSFQAPELRALINAAGIPARP
jgi:hypothetical protein